MNFNLDAVLRHHDELRKLRADYASAGEDPPPTADLLAQIEAAAQTEPAPHPPRVNAGKGTQLPPAVNPDFSANFRRATRGG